MLFRFRACLHPVSLGCQTSWTRWRPAGSRFLSAAPQGNQTKAPSSSRWPPDPKLRYRLCKNTETSSLKTRLVSFRDTKNEDVGVVEHIVPALMAVTESSVSVYRNAACTSKSCRGSACIFPFKIKVRGCRHCSVLRSISWKILHRMANLAISDNITITAQA